MEYAIILNNVVVNVVLSTDKYAKRLPKIYPDTIVVKIDRANEMKSANKGDSYDTEDKIFIKQKPYSDWVLGEDKKWKAPSEPPNNGNVYFWDEETHAWMEKNQYKNKIKDKFKKP